MSVATSRTPADMSSSAMAGDSHMSHKKRKADHGDNIDIDMKFFRTLLTTNAENFALPDKPKQELPIFVAYKTDKIVDVWKGLVKHNFLSCPVVLEGDHKYYGFIDMMDIVRYVIEHFGRDKILGKEKDFWEMVKEEGKFNLKTVQDLMTYPLSRRNPFHPIGLGYSALAVLEPLAREPVLHRVPIIDAERKMYGLVTQSQVIDFLNKNLELIGNRRYKKLSQCNRMFHEVISVSEYSTAYEAFSKMVDLNLSALAVVNADGHLQGSMALVDLKAISPDARLFWRINQTIKNFIIHLKKDLEDRKQRPRTSVTVTPDDTLGDAIQKLAEHAVHRVWIIDTHKTKRPVGVCSVKDILLDLLTM